MEIVSAAMSDAEAIDGIDQGPVEAWFEASVPAVQTPLVFEQIAGGRSNLTYSVSDAAGHRWALRRPPLGKELGSAHDMGRERKVVSALGATAVPVAPIAGYCTDESVIGAPFYVMEFVAGPVLRSLADADHFPEAADRRAIGERVVDTLAQIHALDPDEVGLGDLGRKENFVERTLHRWHGQWQKYKTREIALVDDVHARLGARIPQQGPAAIVHGDYRLDNMILTPAGEVAAVVDWELSTLGDPLADVGLLLVYWGEDGDQLIPLMEPATMAPGFIGRDEVKRRYAEKSGRDLSQIDYFVALGLWKLAIILEGVYARYSQGQYGESAEQDEALTRFANSVVKLAEEADAAEQRLG